MVIVMLGGTHITLILCIMESRVCCTAAYNMSGLGVNSELEHTISDRMYLIIMVIAIDSSCLTIRYYRQAQLHILTYIMISQVTKPHSR